MSNENEEELEVIIEAKPMSIYFNLSQITGYEDESINTLSFGKKRLYSSISGSIAENWEQLIVGYDIANEDNGNESSCVHHDGFGADVLVDLANFRIASQSHSIKNIEELIEAVDVVLKRSFKFMHDFCNECYTENIVYNSFNKELNFNREHVLVILACAHVYRLAIPVLLSFYVDNPDFHVDLQKLILEYFLHVMTEIEKFIGRPCNMQNKLHRLVETRVKSTVYSDAVIWSYMRNIGTTPTEAIHPFFRKLIVDITPKLTISENVINLYHVVLKNQLRFMFCANIPLTYEAINSSIEPDEASVFDTEVNKFDQNEIYTPLVNLGFNDLVNNLKNGIARDIDVTEEEMALYTGEIIPSYETNYLFFSFYGKISGDYEILYKLSKKKYTYLMLLLGKILEKYSLTNLAKVIMSNPEDNTLTMIKVRLSKKLQNQIRESHGFKELQENFFNSIKDKFLKNNPLFSILENIAKSSRKSILPNEDGEYATVTIEDEAVADELIKLTKLIL